MPRKIDSYFSPILYYWSEVSFPTYEMWAHILLPSQSILLCIRWDRECQYTLKIVFLYWNLRDLSLVVRMANGRAPGTNKLPLVVAAGRIGLRRILRPNPGWWLARTVWPEKKQWNHCLPPPHLVTHPRMGFSLCRSIPSEPPLIQLIYGPAVGDFHSASGWLPCSSVTLSFASGSWQPKEVGCAELCFLWVLERRNPGPEARIYW